MIFEIEDDRNNLESEYKKEYYKKKIKSLYKAKPFKNVESNCIIDPFKEHLNSQKDNERLPPRLRTQSVKDFLNQVRSERPFLKKSLPEDPPNEDVIEREKKKHLSTEYRNNFWKTLDGHDLRNHTQSIEITLPDNYVITETTQKRYFRDSRHFFNIEKATKPKPLRPPDNLKHSEKERKILQVRTGDTEYQEIIGKLGHTIMKEQLFGPPRPLELPKVLSTKSICSDILMNASKNHVLSQII